MRVAVVRRQCGLDLGGAERYCANVAIWLSRLGHKVTVIADSSKVEGIDFKRARVWGRGSILKNLSFFHSVRSVLKARDIDCIYGLSRIKGADFLRISDPLHRAWLELGYSGRKIPWQLRRLTPRHLFLLFQEKEAIGSARFVITNSNLVKGQILRYYPIEPQRVITIYNGVDLERFHQMKEGQRRRLRASLSLGKKDSFLILFVGSDWKRKGLLPLLEAVSALKRDLDFHLLVIGVEAGKGLLKACQGLNLLENVSFLGKRVDVERFYMACDLLCLPTYYDPFANVCLEAMACAMPVITTRTNGASELVERMDEGLVVEPGDVAALKEAIQRVATMKSSERSALGDGCARLARQFGWDSHVKRLVECFSRQMGG